MENKQTSGTCAYCEEESDRLFTSPLITPSDWNQVEFDGSMVWWHCPGQAYPGKDLYDVVIVDGVQYLRPYEAPDKPICWQCFNGQIFPAALPYVVNKPPQIKFNGWRFPEWVREPANTACTGRLIAAFFIGGFVFLGIRWLVFGG